MPLPLKDIAKLTPIVERIETGRFDANDVEILLMRLRPYAGEKKVFLEVAHFVAHPDARDRGLAQQSITAFVDALRFFQEYIEDKRTLDLSSPFPSYIYRLFLSQARLADEPKLKKEHRMSQTSLIKKIEANFSLDKKSNTCIPRGRVGVELLDALKFVIGFIHSRSAFHIRDFHEELKHVMRAQAVLFNEDAWAAQMDRMSLAILCLVSNTEFVLPDGSRATCKLDTENHFRLLNGGQMRLPTGKMSFEPTNFGPLTIKGEATVIAENKPPLKIAFPLIATELCAHQHCAPALFLRGPGPEEWGECVTEIINFGRDMSLTADFKLIRTDSIV